jgi:hypothetical protein
VALDPSLRNRRGRVTGRLELRDLVRATIEDPGGGPRAAERLGIPLRRSSTVSRPADIVEAWIRHRVDWFCSWIMSSQ